MCRFNRPFFPFLLLPLLIGANYQVARAQSEEISVSDGGDILSKLEEKLNKACLGSELRALYTDWAAGLKPSMTHEISPPRDGLRCVGDSFTFDGVTFRGYKESPRATDQGEGPSSGTDTNCDVARCTLEIPTFPSLTDELLEKIEDALKQDSNQFPQTTSSCSNPNSDITCTLNDFKQNFGPPDLFYSWDFDADPEKRFSTLSFAAGDSVVLDTNDSRNGIGLGAQGGFVTQTNDSGLSSTNGVVIGGFAIKIQLGTGLMTIGHCGVALQVVGNH